MLSSLLITKKTEWSRFPKKGWQYGGNSSTWAIAGRCDERSVHFSYESCSKMDTQRFNPRIHARKDDDRVKNEKRDTLVLTNFDFDQIIPVLHSNKLISDTSFNHYKTLSYLDFVKNSKEEKYLSFSGTSKDSTWLLIDKDRLKILDALEKANVIPPGISEEYKKFSEEAKPTWDYIGPVGESESPVDLVFKPISLKKWSVVSNSMFVEPAYNNGKDGKYVPLRGDGYKTLEEGQRVESIESIRNMLKK